MPPLIPIAMGAFNWFRSSKVGRIMIAVGAVLIGVFFIYRKGKTDERRNRRIEDLERNAELTERADDAREKAARDVGVLSDDELNQRLSDLGAIRRNGGM